MRLESFILDKIKKHSSKEDRKTLEKNKHIIKFIDQRVTFCDTCKQK